MADEHNPENWHDWFQQWGARFLLFARQQTGSHAEAEDVLQEAFVRIWSRPEQFSSIGPGIVFTQIRRVAIDQARRERRRRLREESYQQETAAPFFLPESGESVEQVQRALEKLAPEQREVLVLRIWGEQTFDEIGQTLDISPNTAASRYRYGLGHLRELLEGGAA